jgi:hypothetical protein
MKRPAQPEEIAPAFVFFAANADSSYITGEVLHAAGRRDDSGVRYLVRTRNWNRNPEPLSPVLRLQGLEA